MILTFLFVLVKKAQLKYDNSNFILKGPFVFLFTIILLFLSYKNHTELCDDTALLLPFLGPTQLRTAAQQPCQPTTQVCDKSPSFAPYGI